MLDLKECLNNSNSNFWHIAGEFDYDLQCLAEKVYNYLFSCEEVAILSDYYECLYEAFDTVLTYDYDMWTVLKAYCTPQEASWGEAMEQFTSDLIEALDIAVELEEDEGE